MAIRINSGARATGTFILPDFPFTMLSYFQADESSSDISDIFTLVDTGTASKKYGIDHNSVDDLRTILFPDGTIAIYNAGGINPISSDFTTWWAVMVSMEADGITTAHNVWSGIGLNSQLYLGDEIVNILTGFFLPVQTATIGPTGSQYINVSEVVLVNRVLTTGQLNLWSHGVPAPQANLPGNILFYQPLVTGYNEPTSIGTVGFTGTGSPVIQSVVGPVMSEINNASLTSGNITTLAQWAEVETDLSGNVIFSDIGQLNNHLILSSGYGAGQVSNQFHITTTGTSGVPDVYNLLDLSQSPINMTIDRSFTSVNSLSIQNLSTGIGQYLDFDVSSSTGFSDMFAGPGQSIVIHPKSCLHRGDSNTGYLVHDTNRVIEITAQSTGVVYELVILGN